MINFVNFDTKKHDPNKSLETMEEVVKVIEGYGLRREEIGLSNEALLLKTYAGLHSSCIKAAEEKAKYFAARALKKQLHDDGGTKEEAPDVNHERIRKAFEKADPKDESGTVNDVLSRAPALCDYLCRLSENNLFKVARQMVYIDIHSDKIDGVTRIFNSNPPLYVNKALRGRLSMYNRLRKTDDDFNIVPIWVEGQAADIYSHSYQALPGEYPYYISDVVEVDQPAEETVEIKPVPIRRFSDLLRPRLEVKDIVQMFLDSRILVTVRSHGKLLDGLRYYSTQQIENLISDLARAHDEGEIEDLSCYLRENQDKIIADLGNKPE